MRNASSRVRSRQTLPSRRSCELSLRLLWLKACNHGESRWILLLMQGQISISVGLSRLPVYEQTTRGIRVRVLPAFLPDQSSPEEGRFLWSYTVTIENCGGETVQLIARYWQITDEA